jgi:uncharacterized nucleotidyltransferase DUF6036
MQRDDFLRAFEALGERLGTPTEIVVAGGSALVLLGIVDRSTADADAVASRPKLSTFARDVAAVADDLDLAPTWLNDGVSAYRELLPEDFASRTVLLGIFDRLTVRVLGRADLIIMKMAAGRPRDLDDLRALAPTADELAFVTRQLPRINALSPRDALRMQLYLEQHGPTPERS